METKFKKLNDEKFQRLKTYLETHENVDESDAEFGEMILVIKYLISKGELDECYITPLTARGLNLKIIRDLNNVILKPGDVFNIHQTVNGRNLFYVESLEPLDIRYAFDHNYKYEYDMEELFAPCRFSGEVGFEIVL